MAQVHSPSAERAKGNRPPRSRLELTRPRSWETRTHRAVGRGSIGHRFLSFRVDLKIARPPLVQNLKTAATGRCQKQMIRTLAKRSGSRGRGALNGCPSLSQMVVSGDPNYNAPAR